MYLKVILIIIISCFFLPVNVTGQNDPEHDRQLTQNNGLKFKLFTKDSVSLSELILGDNGKIVEYTDKGFKSKYHDYEVSLIADSTTIFKDNAVIDQSESDACVLIRPNYFRIGGLKWNVTNSITIGIYHNQDTMSIKILNINKAISFDLGSVYFIPGKYEIDTDIILIERYGGEIIKHEIYSKPFLQLDEGSFPFEKLHILPPPKEWDKRKKKIK